MGGEGFVAQCCACRHNYTELPACDSGPSASEPGLQIPLTNGVHMSSFSNVNKIDEAIENIVGIVCLLPLMGWVANLMEPNESLLWVVAIVTVKFSLLLLSLVSFQIWKGVLNSIQRTFNAHLNHGAPFIDKVSRNTISDDISDDISDEDEIDVWIEYIGIVSCLIPLVAAGLKWMLRGTKYMQQYQGSVTSFQGWVMVYLVFYFTMMLLSVAGAVVWKTAVNNTQRTLISSPCFGAHRRHSTKTNISISDGNNTTSEQGNNKSSITIQAQDIERVSILLHELKGIILRAPPTSTSTTAN